MNCETLTAFQLRRLDKAKRYLRLFLMDTPSMNRLLLNHESSDDLLEFAIEMAIDDWNITTPIFNPVDIGTYGSLYLLMHGSAIQVLKSQGILQARNQLNYNAGGSSFSRHDKSPIYQSWYTNFANEYEVKKRNAKIQYNINRGWGGVHSEYDQIGYSW